VERSEWLDLNRRGMEAAFAGFVRSAGGEVIERQGVVAGINPEVPERSVFNSVVYSDGARLESIRDELAAAYASQGCAWTVWVPEHDSVSAALLEGAGHTLDAEPRAMGMELGGFPEPDLAGVEWSRSDDTLEAAMLNDHAYGYPEGTWLRGTGRAPEGLITYLARSNGTPVATVAARYVDGDCSVWSVATEPQARGRGLASALMRLALWEAAEAGCATTTLQATRLGAPVYRAIGYQDFGALQMWESRPLELAARAQPGEAAPPPGA
jgi:GNAT superfamily N-acetyltransferase